MNWYLSVLKNYAGFEGRARRKEFWMFTLFNVIISVVLGIVDGILGTVSLETGLALFSTIYSLAVLIPSIAVSIRRLHDTNRSGWWLLLALVPIAGIALIVFWCLDSTPGENEFGPNPKGL